MRIIYEIVGNRNGDGKRALKRPHAGLNAGLAPLIETYITYKIQLPWRGKIMKAVCGLIAVLFILGPVGMGMLFNVDAPLIEDGTIVADSEKPHLEDHGTRATPEGAPTFINLYFHSRDNSMNTSAYNYINPDTTGGITFTLQDPLANDFFVEEPSGEFPLMLELYLSGSGTITTEIRDNSEDGPLVGSDSHTFINAQSNVAINRYIPFESGVGDNYTFEDGHYIVIVISIAGTGLLHYDYVGHLSYLRFYGRTITDIPFETHNFFGETTELFYPNDIDFPMERKIVIMKGAISDVFGKFDGKYIDYVQVQIENTQGLNLLRNTTFDRETSEFEYKWYYSADQVSGEYTVTTHAFDEQNNEYTVVGIFNMSDYGVVLTSPDMPENVPEGTYKADAVRSVPLKNVTKYTINVYNIGNNPTTMDISTTGESGWNWWLEGNDITTYNGNQKGNITDLDEGATKSITLAVDSKDNSIGEQVTIVIKATCAADPQKEYDTLNTITTVVMNYDFEIKFLDGSDSTEETVELGDDIEFDFKVTNIGATDDTIWLDVKNLPSGWEEYLEFSDGGTPQSQGDRYKVVLPKNQHEEFTLTLTAPDLDDDDIFDVEVVGESEGSSTQPNMDIVTRKITMSITLTSGLMLELKSAGTKVTDPEKQVDYLFEITNTGTSSADFTVSFTTPTPSEGWGDGISLSQTEFNNVGSQQDEAFTLYVEPSSDVIARNYSITVKAIRNQDANVFKDITVYCHVNEVPGLELVEPSPGTPDLYGEAGAGEDVKYKITIKNTGNVKLSVQILFPDKPKDWTVKFGNASTWSKDIDPGAEEEVEFSFSVPDDAEGDETVDITISVTPSQGDPILIETHTKVKGSISQTLLTLLVPILLFVVIIVMVIVIYKRR
ncbi:MAG: hypothetical protein JSW00_10990 [Thermoplasmata archaeon]|nr:MAG: hypothetical protein JSW00_10990 [Thermoplasmata archaeon]